MCDYSFLFITENIEYIEYMNMNIPFCLSIHWFMNIWVVFIFGAIVSNAAINIHVPDLV